MWNHAPTIDSELHYGHRQVRCFRERPRSIDSLLREAVQRDPEKVAACCGDRRITYGDLDRAANCVAAQLRQREVHRGDRVAILLNNSVEFVQCFFGIMRAGAIAVPLNVREQRSELLHVLNDSGAKALVYDSSLRDRIPESGEVSSLKHRFYVGNQDSAGEPFAQLLQSAMSFAAPAVEEESVAAILYTSGTTGKPKGAMLTHLGLITTTLHYQHCWELNRGDCAVMAVPVSHVTGLAAILLTMVRVGGTTVLMTTFKAAEFLSLASRERMTYTLMVPAMYNLCLIQSDFSAHDLSAWRLGGYGGAPMPPSTVSQLAALLPNMQLVNAYGATETSSPATLTPPGEGTKQLHSVGRPAPCSEIRIVTAEGLDAAPGESGEIWIRGAQVIPGYWANEEATRSSFVDGFWKSGDVGSMAPDGYLQVHDRLKDMINRGGYKVYSAEVEHTLMSHEDIAEAAVVPEPDPVLGEKVRAFIFPRSGRLTSDAVRQFCRERLSDYKVPDFVTFVDAPLPRNANGKILKRALKDAHPPAANSRGPC